VRQQKPGQQITRVLVQCAASPLVTAALSCVLIAASILTNVLVDLAGDIKKFRMVPSSSSSYSLPFYSIIASGRVQIPGKLRQQQGKGFSREENDICVVQKNVVFYLKYPKKKAFQISNVGLDSQSGAVLPHHP
jgi:hypothetical protein